MTARPLIIASLLLLSTQAHSDPWGKDTDPIRAGMIGTAYEARSSAGLVAPLAWKAREITSACGSRIISAVRHTRIAGTRRISLHSYGEAVDIAGNPSCIYAHLNGWPGGYSIDYGRVRHVHISYEPSGREWGARFRHGHRKHRGRA